MQKRPASSPRAATWDALNPQQQPVGHLWNTEPWECIRDSVPGLLLGWSQRHLCLACATFQIWKEKGVQLNLIVGSTEALFLGGSFYQLGDGLPSRSPECRCSVVSHQAAHMAIALHGPAVTHSHRRRCTQATCGVWLGNWRVPSMPLDCWSPPQAPAPPAQGNLRDYKSLRFAKRSGGGGSIQEKSERWWNPHAKPAVLSCLIPSSQCPTRRATLPAQSKQGASKGNLYPDANTCA
jgi:hypothetical protein